MASEALAQKAVENIIKESKEQGLEPPGAITGQGTTDSPYDGGNLPETTTQPGIEPPSGETGAGTMRDLFDQGNAPEQQQVPSVKVEHPAPNGFPAHLDPNEGGAQGTASKNLLEENGNDTADKSKKSTGAAVEGGKFEALNAGSAKEAKRKVSEQRDVSPGTLPDGSHAKTASDRGEVYEASKMSKFKNMLGFGKS